MKVLGIGTTLGFLLVSPVISAAGKSFDDAPRGGYDEKPKHRNGGVVGELQVVCVDTAFAVDFIGTALDVRV
jgi:hypothetical protein